MTQKETSLVLRTCCKDLTSRNGFQWAGVGETTTAPDWNNNSKCGGGLHGWLYGAGDHSCSNYMDADSAWMVLEVVTEDIVMLDGKCKFPSAKTVFVGGRKEAAEYLLANEPRSANVGIIGRIAEVVDNGVLTGGNYATLTGGNYATLTGGDGATLTGGYGATLTGGDGAELRIRYLDSKAGRYRTAIAYVGEDGIEAGVAYRLNKHHKFIKASAGEQA